MLTVTVAEGMVATSGIATIAPSGAPTIMALLQSYGKVLEIPNSHARKHHLAFTPILMQARYYTRDTLNIKIAFIGREKTKQQRIPFCLSKL